MKYQLPHTQFETNYWSSTWHMLEWYAIIECYPLRYYRMGLIKILSSCLQKLKYDFWTDFPGKVTIQKLVIGFWTVTSRRSHQGCSIKKSCLQKPSGLQLLWKRDNNRCFPVNIVKKCIWEQLLLYFYQPSLANQKHNVGW